MTAQKPGETVQGMTVDPVRKTYWIFTNFSLFELIVTNEHRDVWKVYLEKGEYDAALRFAKVSCPTTRFSLVCQSPNRARFKEMKCSPLKQTASSLKDDSFNRLKRMLNARGASKRSLSASLTLVNATR